ncbi:hypothetical protein JCM10296v2_006248 [Rhodotorula toruloides]
MAAPTATHSTTSPARARSASSAPLLAPPSPAAHYGSSTPTTSPGDDAQPSSNGNEVDDPVLNLLGWIWGEQCTFIGLVRDSYIVLGFVLLAKLRELLHLFFVATMWISGCILFPIGLIAVFLFICSGWMMLAVCVVDFLGPAGLLIHHYSKHILQGVKLAFLTNAPPSRCAIATLLATPLVPLLTHTLLVLLDFRLSTTSWTLVYVDSTIYRLVRWAEWQKRRVRLADEEEELDKDGEEDADKP